MPDGLSDYVVKPPISDIRFEDGKLIVSRPNTPVEEVVVSQQVNYGVTRARPPLGVVTPPYDQSGLPPLFTAFDSEGPGEDYYRAPMPVVFNETDGVWIAQEDGILRLDTFVSVEVFSGGVAAIEFVVYDTSDDWFAKDAYSAAFEALTAPFAGATHKGLVESWSVRVSAGDRVTANLKFGGSLGGNTPEVGGYVTIAKIG